MESNSKFARRYDAEFKQDAVALAGTIQLSQQFE
jgi:transposase-like protein